MRVLSAAVLILCAATTFTVFAAPPSLGTDVQVTPRENGYLFEIIIKDLASNKVLLSPRIVTQANQPAEVTSDKEGGKLRTSVRTDGAFAEVRVEFLEDGIVTASSRMRLSVSAK